jgi:pSer/pThr/pTyr-binding forkhead associated (FHA) protein
MHEETMQDDSIPSDDPGTILESFDRIPLHIPVAARPTQQPAAPEVKETVYRSPRRWRAPRITICDDDTLDDGETIYIRADKAIIGRKAGDIVIGNDVAMSATHAEIVRTESEGLHTWMLRDLESSNGTLARAEAIALRNGTTIQLGSKRYRFTLPQQHALKGECAGNPGTAIVDDMRVGVDDLLPALVESGSTETTVGVRHPLRGTRIAIGRPDCGNDISIDDPCLATCHAVITRDGAGTYRLKATASLNGVWVRINAVRLTGNCFFQCGEQRFRFQL